MSEEISYAWGESSLGGFIVATSHAGIVAFEFADNRIARLGALMQRFPDIRMQEDQSGLADLIEKLSDVVDQPESGEDSGAPRRAYGRRRVVCLDLR